MRVISGVAYSIAWLTCSQLALLFSAQAVGGSHLSSYHSRQQPNAEAAKIRSSHLQAWAVEQVSAPTGMSVVAYKPPKNGGPRRPTKGTGTRLQTFLPEALI